MTNQQRKLFLEFLIWRTRQLPIKHEGDYYLLTNDALKVSRDGDCNEHEKHLIDPLIIGWMADNLNPVNRELQKTWHAAIATRYGDGCKSPGQVEVTDADYIEALHKAKKLTNMPVMPDPHSRWSRNTSPSNKDRLTSMIATLAQSIGELVVAPSNKDRLASMIATGIKPQSGGGDWSSGDLWEIREFGFVSALTGQVSATNEVDILDMYIACLPRSAPMDKCVKEAEQRIADYEATDGDIEECLRLIEERKFGG